MSHGEAFRVGIDVTAIPSNPAGAGRYVVELVRALARRADIDLELYARQDDARRWTLLAAAPPHVVRPVAPQGRAARLVYGELLLGLQVRRSRPSLAVFHGPHYSLPRLRSGPEVVTVHDLTMVEHPEWHERTKVAFFSAAMRRATARADAIIVLSEADAERFRARFSPRGDVVVIPHGVDHQRFRPTEPSLGADEQARQRLGVTTPYLLHLGTIEPRKNLPTLLGAFEQLRRADPELELVLAGSAAWGAHELARVLESSTVAAAVRRLGYVDDDDVPSLLRGAAAVAYPSSAEGFGLPVLEALACGAPTVTTTNSVMEQIAKEAALLAPAGDATALAAALRRAMDGGKDAIERRQRGLARAAEFSWEASAAAHRQTYERGVGGVMLT